MNYSSSVYSKAVAREELGKFDFLPICKGGILFYEMYPILTKGQVLTGFTWCSLFVHKQMKQVLRISLFVIKDLSCLDEKMATLSIHLIDLCTIDKHLAEVP